MAPGESLTVPVQIQRAIWNPNSDEFSQELGGFRLADWRHNPSSDSIILTASSDAPKQPPTTVHVPDVSPGRYLLLVLDGTEGGTHFTWDYVTVAEGASREESDSDNTLLLAAGLGAAALVAAAFYMRARR